MKKGLITSILALTFGGLQAQPLPAAPKLVVTLTIDQLRTDYLENFSPLYGERGFKRLLREGKVYRQIEMPFDKPDRSSGIATLCTGCPPSTHGIIANRWMDVSTLTVRSCVDDPDFMGYSTDLNSSPSRLLTSTVADELKIATRNAGKVYAIAPFRDAAILSAGHAGDGAFWINEVTGKWCGTTYYKDFPEWLSRYNDSCSVDFRIKDIEWTPLRPMSDYKYLPDWRTEPFKYLFNAEKENKFRRLKVSPITNDEVNLLVAEVLDKSGIGKDEVTDLLALTYYAGNYNHYSIRECAMEMQDTYVRLDHSIATLLDLLDRKIGLHNLVLCIASTGYADPEPADTGIYGHLPHPRRRVSPEPMRHVAQHVPDGHLWRRTICGSVLRPANLSQPQADRRQATGLDGHPGKISGFSGAIQRSRPSIYITYVAFRLLVTQDGACAQRLSPETFGRLRHRGIARMDRRT